MKDNILRILEEFKKGQINKDKAFQSIEIEYGRLKTKEQWILEKRDWLKELFRKELKAFINFGYFEFNHYLEQYIDTQLTYDQLLDGMRKSKCRNTGWPIGMVFTKDILQPKTNNLGEVYSLLPPNETYETYRTEFDLWILSKDLNFFFARSLEEDSEITSKNRYLFFDVHIWRIAEILLHTARFYEAFNISSDEKFNLEIRYVGLKDRIFESSNIDRAVVNTQCNVEEFVWQDTLTTSLIKENHFEITNLIVSKLFHCFQKTISSNVQKDIFTEFINSKV